MGAVHAWVVSLRRSLLVLGTISLGALTGMGAVVTAATVAAPPPERDTAQAVAAKMLFMTQKSQMHLASAPGVTIKEVGTMTGTYRGTVVASITSYSVSRGSLTLTAYVSGGAVTVKAETHNRVSGSTGYSEGVAHIIHGTGIFAHASSSTLAFHATINRTNFHTTAEVRGRISL